MNMNTIKAQLFKSFMDKEKRDLFVSQNIGTTISAQLFSMREKKDWTQEELAQKTEMAQARISVLENPNYENFSIKTLKRLASAFDVGLMVRFVSFGELADWVSNLSPEDLAVPDFEHESQLQETEAITLEAKEAINLPLEGFVIATSQEIEEPKTFRPDEMRSLNRIIQRPIGTARAL